MTYNAQALTTLINDTSYLCDHIDTPYMQASETFDNEDDLREYLQERINEVEVIYYNAAIKFLGEEDQSLMESLGLAHELGYTAAKISSELLATLLLQQKLNEELAEIDLSPVFDAEA